MSRVKVIRGFTEAAECWEHTKEFIGWGRMSERRRVEVQGWGGLGKKRKGEVV